jgi:transposase
MLRQMERSTIHLLVKRGQSQRQIARELGRSRTTVARALAEPVERRGTTRERSSQADAFAEQITEWLGQGLSIVRMTELAREDPDHPYNGGRSVFSDAVRQIRRAREEGSVDVPLRFEGLPGEYLQVDWGEMRHFPFTRTPPATRYFLACRLKYSRWSFVLWTSDMRQETLLRGLVACFRALGFVPWVLIFDNMKTVTSGRDPQNQPVWTAALLHLAASFDFHPEACAPRAANQKGSVESLVKWVKGNFLAGRSFTDDADLAEQNATWLVAANNRSNAATNVPPNQRLPDEAAKGGALPSEAADFALRTSAQVSDESLVPFEGNVYSVPLGHVGAPITLRIHAERVRIWRDTLLLADHRRAEEGAHRRTIDPAHFAPLFPQKKRAQVMLYRATLLDLDPIAAAYVSEVARRRRATLRGEILSLYHLVEEHGAARMIAAMREATAAGAYGEEYVGALLREDTSPITVRAGGLPLPLPGVPPQGEIDRLLSSYEAFVEGATVRVGGWIE